MDIKLINYIISGLLIVAVAIGSIEFHKTTGDPLYWIAAVLCVGLLLHWKWVK